MSAEVEALLGQHSTEVAARLIKRAVQDGNVTAARIILDRTAPVRGSAVSFEMPADVTTAKGLMEAHAYVLKSVAAGQLTTSEGESLCTMLSSLLKSIEVADINERIAALEQKTGIRR